MLKSKSNKDTPSKLVPYCDRCNRGLGVVEYGKKLYCFKCIKIIRDEQLQKDRKSW